jgi:transposase
MFHLEKQEQRKVFIRSGATDLRKGISGLSVMVQEEMELNAFSGSYFVFSNYGRNLIKILYWDLNGFCLWQKRLEKDHFPWPKKSSGTIELTMEQINWLLSGIDHFNAYKKLHYSSIS